MKVLVTGGAGFIGSHLAEELLDRGEEVYVIDNLSTGKKENIAHLESHPKFHFTIETVLNEKVTKQHVDQCETIYHLAAAVGVKHIVENPLESVLNNIHGAEIILRLANPKKRKVILTSTSEIYGKSSKVPFSEEDDRILGPTTIMRWSYSDSKAIDEYLGLAYWQEKRLPVIIVRLFNTCGPRQSGDYGMVIPRFVKQALQGHPILIFGDGKQTRCFCDVHDIVHAMIDLSRNPDAPGEIFNIGSEEEVSIEELANKVKKLTGSKSLIHHIPYDQAYEKGFEDMPRRVPDLAKIKKWIGYNPKYTLDDLLVRVIEYYKS
jgi:UDP-glucose 4-epimerase